MFKVLLIDDEPLARKLLRSFLSDYSQFEVAGEAGDGFEGFKEIQDKKPDLVFLDIQMPKLTGLEMLELLDDKPSLIFTTAYNEYALQAFEQNAIDYLLKPLTEDRFAKAIQKWLQQSGRKPAQAQLDELNKIKASEGYQQRIVIKDGGKIRIVPTEEILCLEASDDYVKVHTKEHKFLKKTTMGALEQILDPAEFVRVHRSYMIPIRELLRIEPYDKDGAVAVLQNGLRVQVSKSGLAKLKAQLNW